MKCSIEVVQGKLPHKFVVARNGKDFLLYAVQQFNNPDFENDEVSHRQIASRFGLQDVVGGGVCNTFIPVQLNIINFSATYNGVPMEILAGFKDQLLESYRKISPEIHSIVFD